MVAFFCKFIFYFWWNWSIIRIYMYLSTRISRLCKRSPFLSLYISVCVCVCDCVCDFVCVCVCVCFGLVFQSLLCMGGMEGIISLLVFKIISYFPYLLLFFSSFLMIFPLPAMATKLPLSFPLLVMFMCVCVCVRSWLSTSVLLILTGLPNFLDYWYLCINIY